jgi:hypothetical protein
MDSIYASALDDGGDQKDAKKEEDLPPLRAESIYNMAFVVRPTTAIVTHGESNEAEEACRQNNESVIREEDDSREEDSWQHNQGGSGGVEADVWVAGGDDDNDDGGNGGGGGGNGDGGQPDSPMTPATAAFAADYTQHPGRAPQVQRASQAGSAAAASHGFKNQKAAGSGVAPPISSSLDQLAADSYARYTSVGLHDEDDVEDEAEGSRTGRDAPVQNSCAVDCRAFIR